MPERTSDGQWKWGNVKRKSRKELSQTVYGIWKGTGSKGSFHNFYHYGNGFRTSKKNKLKKESYQLNPLLEGKELDHIKGTITDEREKAFLVAARKISKEFSIIKDIVRDDNCIYVNLKSNCEEKKEELDTLKNALDTLSKGFHFGRVDYQPDGPQFSSAFFSIGSCPSDRYCNDLWKYMGESVNFFDRPLFSKANVTYDQIGDIIKKLKSDIDHGKHTLKYKNLLQKKYWELRTLRVIMRRKSLTEVPLSVIEKISGSN